MPFQDGAFIWPGESAVPGVPPALLERVKGPLNFEQFAGAEVSSRSEHQFVTVTTAGSTTTSQQISPPAGDTVTDGLWELTLDPDPVAVKGHARRQEATEFSSDCFGSDRPTIWAVRYRLNSADPTAATYEAQAGGICAFTGGSGNPTDEGTYWIFDPTLGIQSWVCRSSRLGVDIQSVPAFANDANFHTVGFLHDGNQVIPFFDNTILDTYTGPEIQPAASVFAVSGRLRAFAAGGVTGDINHDWCLWGR